MTELEKVCKELVVWYHSPAKIGQQKLSSLIEEIENILRRSTNQDAATRKDAGE